MFLRKINKICQPFIVNRFSTSIQHFVNQAPVQVQLKIQQQEQIPKLIRKQDELLVEQWWSQTPFDFNKPLEVPIFSFKTGEFLKQTVVLDQNIFNQPIRRDIIHRVLIWRQKLFKIKTHVAKTVGTRSGSGKKPMPQKGQGKARQGNKRAPHLRKGGKALGPVLRTCRIKLNKKIRLQSIKIMLSARLAEGKLRIVDTEALEEYKTKNLRIILDNFDANARLLIITGYNQNQQFNLASQNLFRVETCSADRINILKLMKSQRILITLDGLRCLVQDLNDRTFLKYKTRLQKGAQIVSINERDSLKPKIVEDKVVYDPSKPLELKFRILRDYQAKYEKLQEEGKLDKYNNNYR